MSDDCEWWNGLAKFPAAPGQTVFRGKHEIGDVVLGPGAGAAAAQRPPSVDRYDLSHEAVPRRHHDRRRPLRVPPAPLQGDHHRGRPYENHLRIPVPLRRGRAASTASGSTGAPSRHGSSSSAPSSWSPIPTCCSRPRRRCASASTSTRPVDRERRRGVHRHRGARPERVEPAAIPIRLRRRRRHRRPRWPTSTAPRWPTSSAATAPSLPEDNIDRTSTPQQRMPRACVPRTTHIHEVPVLCVPLVAGRTDGFGGGAAADRTACSGRRAGGARSSPCCGRSCSPCGPRPRLGVDHAHAGARARGGRRARHPVRAGGCRPDCSRSRTRSAPTSAPPRANPAPSSCAGTGSEVHVMAARPKVVIVGAGFGGLQCAKALAGKPVDVLARRPPQLPPVHAAAVPGRELPAEPVGDRRAAAQGVPRRAERAVPPGRGRRRRLRTAQSAARSPTATTLEYDALVLATGSTTNYYGNDDVEQHALGLKDLGEALQLRNHVLDVPRAARRRRPDGDERRRTADVLHRRRRSDRRRVRGRARRARAARAAARVSGARRRRRAHRACSKAATALLPTFMPRLSRVRAARARAARRRGALRTRWSRRPTTVGVVARRRHRARRPRRWCGPRACSPADPADDARTRTRIDGRRPPARRSAPTDVYAIGDVAAGARPHGHDAARCSSPPAMQAGRYVARADRRRAASRKPFRYRDKGTLATIGRQRRGRPDRPAPVHRLHRLDRLARRAPLLPDRLREPRARAAALGLVLRPPRPPRPHRRPRRRRPLNKTFSRQKHRPDGVY